MLVVPPDLLPYAGHSHRYLTSKSSKHIFAIEDSRAVVYPEVILPSSFLAEACLIKISPTPFFHPLPNHQPYPALGKANITLDPGVQ